MEYSDRLNQVYQFFTKCSGSQEKGAGKILLTSVQVSDAIS